MNRFAFFISLILLVNLSSNFEFDKKVYGTIYDKAILLIKGMSDSKEPQCYNTFRDKKDILLDFFLELIPYIQTHSEEISLSYIFSLFYSLVRKGLPMTFLDDCKIVPLYGIYEDFIDYNTRVERIQTFGKNIQNNIDKFFDASSKFVKTRGLDGKLLLIGQILSAVTDFVFD